MTNFSSEAVRMGYADVCCFKLFDFAFSLASVVLETHNSLKHTATRKCEIPSFQELALSIAD